jgi:hypothetical protein
MKKYILGVIAIIVIVIVAALNVGINTEDQKLSNISLANVEALALENADGYSKVTIIEVSSTGGCVGNQYMTCILFSTECSGTGHLSCVGESWIECFTEGPCHWI